MSSTFLLIFLVSYSVIRQSVSIPNTCVTCVNCQDQYAGIDLNASCSLATPTADSCQKIRLQLPGTTFTLKACAKNCQEQSIIAGPFRLDVACCTTDNCNRAQTISIETLLLIFSLFISFYVY